MARTPKIGLGQNTDTPWTRTAEIVQRQQREKQHRHEIRNRHETIHQDLPWTRTPKSTSNAPERHHEHKPPKSSQEKIQQGCTKQICHTFSPAVDAAPTQGRRRVRDSCRLNFMVPLDTFCQIAKPTWLGPTGQNRQAVGLGSTRNCTPQMLSFK